MRSAAALMMVVAIACAGATFIENDFGGETARAAVYNALWFEAVLFLLCLIMIANIFRMRMWRRGKLTILIFHISFIVIILGAAITRYFGFEGTMHIREGETSELFLSNEPYLKVSSSGLSQSWQLIPSAITDVQGEYVTDRIGGGAPVTIRAKEYYRFATEVVAPVNEGGREYISVMITFGGAQMAELSLFDGDCYDLGSVAMCFGEEFDTDRPMILLSSLDNQLVLKSYSDLIRVSAESISTSHEAQGDLDDTIASLRAHTAHPFDKGMIYKTIDGISFAINEHIPQADRKIVPSKTRTGSGALIVEIEHKGDKKELALLGGAGMTGKPVEAELSDRPFVVSFGSEALMLPFSLRLDKFMIERYPGSKSPSSYESKVTLIDKESNIEEARRIYMNHILIHKQYRFYQSSFDQDEQGTILSVSHDPGVWVTYLGYAMLMFGIIAAFFSPQSRFRALAQQIEKSRKHRSLLIGSLALIVFAFAAIPSEMNAEEQPPRGIIAKSHAEKFDRLLVQDIDGRIKPFQTLSKEALRKIARKDEFNTLSASQVFLGMMSAPEGWQQVPLIRINHPEIAPLIGLQKGEKYAKFSDFFQNDEESGKRFFKLDNQVYEAFRVREAERNKLQKELIKVYERVDIANSVYQGNLARVIPIRDDPNFAWTSPAQMIDGAIPMKPEELKVATQIFFDYYQALREAQVGGDWLKADFALETLSNYQREWSAAVIPSNARIAAEIALNDIDPFNLLLPICFLLGSAALFFAFLEVFKPSRELWRKTTEYWISVAIWVAFAFHTCGLGLRWYVSEHAPWSNGYESVIYIAWATLLAGLIFARRSVFALPAATLMAGFALMASHLNMMDPQITNLVPVLKSYWLTLHVSTISASYGFFGLCMLLGLLALFVFVFRSTSAPRRDEAIAELARINEMSMMVGLALLSIGNFLGAIWANESWGRYWSWDPKETWTLVSMLCYTAILHLRFIPPMRSAFVFSFFSVIAFGVIIMTYFGVNLYLTGMHSYASGDPVPVPTSIYFILPALALLSALAARNSDGIYPLEVR
jgi:cytochrome c-type biogenesis protein CcsB